MLRRLQDDALLHGVSHLIVDEAHERSEESDFLLMAIARMLPANPTLRVLLMSATLNADLFSAYFGGAPTLTIPGRTFPVTPLYLEDAIELTRHVVRK